MTCKRNGAVTVAWRLLVRYSVRLQRRLNSDRRQEFWDFLGSRRTVMGTRLLCCSLSRTTTPAVWVSVLVVGREAYARNAEDEQLTFLWRLVDTSDGGTTTTSPRPGDASPTTTWPGCIFFACLSMTQDRTTTYRVTTCATATRLSLVVWHVWRFLVRYNNRGRRRRVDQNDRSFLSFFFHFWSKNSAETWNNRSPRSTEHFGAKKLEIDLRQKPRFWSVHACLNRLNHFRTAKKDGSDGVLLQTPVVPCWSRPPFQ